MKKLLFILSLIIGTLATQAQEYETIIENFDDNSRSWRIEDNEKYLSYIKDGVYYIENKSTEYTYY